MDAEAPEAPLGEILRVVELRQQQRRDDVLKERRGAARGGGRRSGGGGDCGGARTLAAKVALSLAEALDYLIFCRNAFETVEIN